MNDTQENTIQWFQLTDGKNTVKTGINKAMIGRPDVLSVMFERLLQSAMIENIIPTKSIKISPLDDEGNVKTVRVYSTNE